MRLPQEMIAAVVAWVDRERISRSEAVRRLLESALQAKATVKRQSKRRKKAAPKVPQPAVLKMPGIQTD